MLRHTRRSPIASQRRGGANTERGKMKKRCTLVVLFLTLLGAAFPAAAQEKPAVIRVATPGVGIGNRPVVGGSVWSVVHLKGLLEEEFKKDGIRIEWNFLRGAGPAVNELYANGLVDFASYGDLPSIVGHASGLDTRVLAGGGRSNLVIAVPADSQVQKVQDLKGQKLAVFKGTCLQLAAARILEKHGLSEREVRAINMDSATSRAALATGDVDGVIGMSDLFSLRDQGVARVIYISKGDASVTCNGTLTGTASFVNKYPDLTKRVVKVYVQASKWLADRQADSSEAFQLWTRSGVRFTDYKEDWQGDAFKERASPLLDAYIVSRYDRAIGDAKRYGLIRNSFQFEPWAERRFLDEVLKEEGLQGFWPAQPASPQ
jgi:sulfonate transport system substrate-binding protein